MATRNSVNTSLSGQTGTVNFVGSTSPSITTPNIITSLRDVNGADWILVNPQTTAVNNITVSNAPTLNAVGIAATGADSNITLSLAGKGVLPCQIKGFATDADVTTGYVGEVMSSIIGDSSAISLTSTTAANITSLNLTAGDWDVWTWGIFIAAAGTIPTLLITAVSNTSATLPSTVTPSISQPTARLTTTFGTASRNVLPVASARISLGTTTTYYMVSSATFSVSTLTGSGVMVARRRS